MILYIPIWTYVPAFHWMPVGFGGIGIGIGYSRGALR
jgi:hypothetical protein